MLSYIRSLLSVSHIQVRTGFPIRLFSMANTLEEDLEPQQKLLLKEQCILVNESDEVIGSASKKECHLLGPDGSPPPLHRAFSVFIFNSDNQLLLQQRSDFKITFPLHYTNTCCSHPLFVDDEREQEGASGVKRAACRRLAFELGIPIHELKPSELTYLTRIYYSSPSSAHGRWGEHEIDYILFLKKDVTLDVNANEVKEVQYVSRTDFDGFLGNLKKDDVPITPWFRMIAEKFLPEWWRNIDDLAKFSDHDTIHRMS